MLKQSALTIAAILAVATGVAHAIDVDTPIADFETSLVSETNNTASMPVGSNNTWDIDDAATYERFALDRLPRAIETAYQALVERDEARAQVAYLQRLVEAKADQSPPMPDMNNAADAARVMVGQASKAQHRVNIEAEQTAPGIHKISCGFPYHYVLALPKGSTLLTTMRMHGFIETQEFMVDDQAYVVVTLHGAKDAADEASLTVFTSSGPAFFVVDGKQDQIDHYVELN